MKDLFGIRALNEWLSDKPRHTIGMRILQVCIGLVICFRIATELPFAGYLYGPNGISTYQNADSYFGSALGSWIAAVFYTSNAGIYCLVGILFLAALMLLFNLQTRLGTFICLFGFIALFEQRAPVIGDGGDNLTRLILIYMLLLLSHPQ